MRLSDKNIFKSTLVDLKDNSFLENQRIAGKIAAQTLSLLQNLVADKTTKSLIELNTLAEEYIIQAGGTPTFKNYKGFPAGVCISVNKQLVHGIPTNYLLKEGDVVSFDLGATFQGAIADSAITCIYGNPKSDNHVKLIEANYQCLIKGIESIKIGARLGVIGQAISRHAKNCGFGLITQYGGHGISITKEGVGIPHAPPFVANKSTTNEGIRIQPGLVIAIEPMLVIGSPETRTLSDGWTVMTEDISCHAEHSIFVHEDHVEIMTYRNDDTLLKSNKYYFNNEMIQ